jgi:hypothetical protein
VSVFCSKERLYTISTEMRGTFSGGEIARLKEFSVWEQLHLKGHHAETHGNIRVTKESAATK